MPQYRIYFLSNRTGRIERHEEFEATDDEAALGAIEAHRLGDRPVELWTAGRKVVHLDTGLATSGLPSHSTGSSSELHSAPSRGAFRF